MLFIIPFLIILLLEIIIDPYNYIRKEPNNKKQALKKDISYKTNYPLFKLIAFDRNPTPVIILGDSRAEKLNSQYFEDLETDKTSNLAYGGGDLPELIKTFWYAAKTTKLKKVYIGIDFEMYNQFINTDRVSDAISTKSSIASYLLSKSCFKATWFLSEALFLHKKVEIGKPTETPQQFWQSQINKLKSTYFKHYAYPETYLKDLKKITTYCSNNSIELIYFIPPTHLDLQNKTKELHLTDKEIQFVKDISTLGNLYNFNYPNDITKNRNNFSDPFHCNDSISKIIVKEIVTGNVHYSKFSKVNI